MVSTLYDRHAAEEADVPLTEAERAERANLIAKARAQIEAGEVVEGEEVFRWARSLGTETELQRPRASKPPT